jgi:glutamine synthetase
MTRGSSSSWSGLAREHGVAASFMAKPYEDYAGNGLHAHFSILDAMARTSSTNGPKAARDLLGHALGGCLSAMPGSMLIFAPHGQQL